jgi:hypothetical protein
MHECPHAPKINQRIDYNHHTSFVITQLYHNNNNMQIFLHCEHNLIEEKEIPKERPNKKCKFKNVSSLALGYKLFSDKISIKVLME